MSDLDNQRSVAVPADQVSCYAEQRTTWKPCMTDSACRPSIVKHIFALANVLQFDFASDRVVHHLYSSIL